MRLARCAAATAGLVVAVLAASAPAALAGNPAVNIYPNPSAPGTSTTFTVNCANEMSPQPASSATLTGTRIVTGPVAYIRLHGRNARAWFSRDAGRDEKYDYLYSREELRLWEEAIGEMEADRLFLILNNHFQGKAIANALEDGKPVDTVMGPVRFDRKGDILDPSYDINQWSAGKYAPIAR